MKRLSWIFLLALIGMSFSSCQRQVETDQKPAPKPVEKSEAAEHRCAWCGMDAAQYPKWEYIIELENGETMYFDGAKCMFRILLIESRRPEGITAIKVKDYYDLEYVDAREAFYVIGSDVLGPMGHELVPFRTMAAAAEFKTDHQGIEIVRFDDVTMETIAGLSKNTEMK